jgi:hypothetical protein
MNFSLYLSKDEKMKSKKGGCDVFYIIYARGERGEYVPLYYFIVIII